MIVDAPPSIVAGVVSHSSAKNELIRRWAPRDARVVIRFLMGDTHRPSHVDELSVPTVSDGARNSKQCACFRKLQWWLRFAVVQWPHAEYYAKIEDDAYVHFPKLLHDLMRPYVRVHTRLMYGLINTCNEKRFIGDFETGSVSHGVPFPTGPLNVFSPSLARELASCRTELYDTRSIAGHRCEVASKPQNIMTCDCGVGIALQRCMASTSIVVAHMTWTKGHWHAKHSGGMGWVRADAQSVAVHGVGLKGMDERAWSDTHRFASGMNVTTFPPLMWRVSLDGQLQKKELNPSTMRWYRSVCSKGAGPLYNASYMMGNKNSWRAFGCHELRGHLPPHHPDEFIKSRSASPFI